MDGITPPQKGGDDNTPDFQDHGRIGRLKEQMYSRATQPAKRPRRELSALEKDIPDDWQEEAPPVKRESAIPKSYSFPSILLVIAVLVFVVAGGVAASFLINGSNVVSAQKIDIAINGPRTIGGGEVLELQVAVRNNNSATLELADLVINYPEGTRMPGNLNTTMTNQRIPLGTIEPGGTRNGTVRGVLFGRAGERQDIVVSLEYRLSGSSALFNTDAIHTVLVSSGTIDIAVQANERQVAGQFLDATITVTSNAKTTTDNVTIRPSYPFGFAPENTTPATNQDGFWDLGSLEPGEVRTLRVRGKLDGQTGDERILRFIAVTEDVITRNGRTERQDVVLAEAEHVINVERPFLGMTLAYDELPSEEYIARTGETIPISLTWTNNLDVALSDVVIAATLSGPGLDPFNVSADAGFYRSIDSVVLWDKTTTKGELETVPAGAQGSLLLRLTPAQSDAMAGVQDPTLRIELHAAAQRLSEGSVPETIQATVTEEVKIATDTTFVGHALYFENPLGSVGPLPPKVEHETTYGILWEVTNTTNLVRDTKVTATLPPYVRWLGVVSPAVEHVTFNENDGTVTWHIGKLLPDTGISTGLPRRVAFSVGLVPSTSQVGQTPALIQNQRLTGVDNFVNLPVSIDGDELTTNLNEVDFADIYGVIVP